MKTKNFTREERHLYLMCTELFKDYYPSVDVDRNWVKDQYNSNRNPNMREYDEISNN
jgi:hypothetical protein